MKTELNRTHLGRTFGLLGCMAVLLGLLWTACEQGTEPVMSVTEIPKKTSTDVRDSYVLFEISNSTTLNNYHLAVKKASEEKPTAAEMTAGALKRNISPNSINVLIAQEMDNPMISFAKAYFADNTHTTLGTDMGGSYSNNFGFVADKNATGTNAWVAQSVLKPSTQYKLYGMAADSTKDDSVTSLLSFTTDESVTSFIDTTSTANETRPIDSTLANDNLEIAVNADEYYIFPIQSKLLSSEPIDKGSFNFVFSGQETGNTIIELVSFILFGNSDLGYGNSLLITTGSTSADIFSSYVLIHTKPAYAHVQNKPSGTKMYYAVYVAGNSGTASLKSYFSVLQPQ